MRQAYFDSSAIVKLSHAEAHSTALVEYLDGGEVEASTSVVAEVEVMRALRRAGAAADQAVMGFYLLALDADVREEAARLGSSQVRALDAIHLATALAIGDDDLEFITYDDRQADAAREEGLTVVQPGRQLQPEAWSCCWRRPEWFARPNDAAPRTSGGAVSRSMRASRIAALDVRR